LSRSSFAKVWLLPGARFDELERSVAFIAVGAVERHGDHLPLGTDTIVAHYIAERAAEELGAHLYPPIWYGSSKGLRRFGGTIDVDDDALEKYFESVLREIVRQGYELVVVVNGHGGNSNIVRKAARRVAHDTGTAIMVVDWWRELAQDVRKELFKYPGHAGEDETSAVLAIIPEAVDMRRAHDHIVEEVPRAAIYSPRIEEMLYPRAVLGAGARGDAERGKRWIEAMVEHLVHLVREALSMLRSGT